MSNSSTPQTSDRLLNYYKEEWNAVKLEAEIAAIAHWADRNGVEVIANEFGVYKPDAPAAERVAWIQDTRSLLEKYDIGWTMWDYTGGFGLTSGKLGGDRQVDRGVAVALGLT